MQTSNLRALDNARLTVAAVVRYIYICIRTRDGWEKDRPLINKRIPPPNVSTHSERSGAMRGVDSLSLSTYYLYI